MKLTAHTLTPDGRTTRRAKRVGRGNASHKGTTAARGTKGQKARSGGRKGLKIKGFKQSLLKVPKVRGFKSMYARPETVTLASLNRKFESGATVTPRDLMKAKLIGTTASGVKILGTGELTKALTIKGCVASKSAAAAIEKAGGKLEY